MRAVDWAAGGLWREWSIDETSEYDKVFQALCRRYEGPGWDLSDLSRALAEEMSVRSDRTAQAIALEIQARVSRFRAEGDNT